MVISDLKKNSFISVFVLLIALNIAWVPPLYPPKTNSFRVNNRNIIFQPKKAFDSHLYLVEPKGSDAFSEINAENDKNKIRKALGKMGPKTAKNVSTGLVPLAVALGFIATPGSRAVSIAGAAVMGLVSSVARLKIGQESKAAVPVTIANLLEKNGITKVRPADISKVFDDYGIKDEEAKEICIDIFRRYILAMCKNSATKAADIRELRDLRQALNLTGEDIGNAIFSASSVIYKDRILFTPSEELDDPHNPNRKAVDKFLFLSDRLFEVGDTEEAYEYEMGRIRKVFGLDSATVKNRTVSIAKPFYETALNAARDKLDTLRPGALELAEKTLGIAKYLKDEMHIEAFSNEVKSLLEENSGAFSFKDGATERLKKLGDALGLDENVQRGEIEAVSVPIFEKFVSKEIELALEMQIKDSEDAKRNSALRKGRLASLQLKLLLEPETSNRVIKSTVNNAAQAHFVAACKFVRVNNERKAFDAAKELIAFLKSSFSLVAGGMNEGGKKSSEQVISEVFEGFLFDSSAKREGTKLYQLFLKTALKSNNGRLSEQDKEDLEILSKMMGQDALDIEKAYSEETKPVLKSAFEPIFAKNDFTDENKNNIADLVAKLNIPQRVVKELNREFYSLRARSYSLKSNGGILAETERNELLKVKEFLNMEQSEVEAIHKEFYGKVYQQSVTESMASTGVISEELKKALEVLRERLILSKEDAKNFTLNAYKMIMKPKVEQLCYEFERTSMKGKKRGIDEGDDILVAGPDAGNLGISSSGSVISEIMTLVDFYNENGIAERNGDDVTFPITAEGMGSERLFEKIYQQFVVTGFTTEGSQGQRYVESQKTLAGLLGLAPSKVELIHSEIGNTVVSQFFRNNKKPVGSQELAALAGIGSKLGLGAEEFDKIVLEAKKTSIKTQIERLFQQKNKITKAQVKEVRERAESLGLELSAGLGVPLERLKKMFMVEAIDLIEGSKESTEDIEEAAEAFGFDEEKVKELLGELLDERASAAVKDAASELQKQLDSSCVKSVEKLLFYCSLAGDLKVKHQLSPSVAQEILDTYLASRSENSDKERAEVEADSALLKSALGLS